MPVVEVVRDCPNVGKRGTRANLTDVEANTLILLGYVREVVPEKAFREKPSSGAKKVSKKAAKKKSKAGTYKRRDMVPEDPDGGTGVSDAPADDESDSTA